MGVVDNNEINVPTVQWYRRKSDLLTGMVVVGPWDVRPHDQLPTSAGSVNATDIAAGPGTLCTGKARRISATTSTATTTKVPVRRVSSDVP
jgi:hypothetical protein